MPQRFLNTTISRWSTQRRLRQRTSISRSSPMKMPAATSDGVEQVIILGQGCRLISARELKEELDRVNGMLREEYLEQPGLKRNRLYDILPEEVIRQMKEAAAEDKQD